MTDQELCAAICDKWTLFFGIGFHPDNSAESLECLNQIQKLDYDHDMAILFDLSPDPYDDGLAAFKRANLI